MRQTRKREHEKLDEANLNRVIELLEGDIELLGKLRTEVRRLQT